jgi:exosortase/archaeosortase family protein
MVLRTMFFLTVFTGLELGWESLHGGGIEYVVIHNMTVWPAVYLINLYTPAVQAVAVNFSVQAAGGGLNILNGCEGMEALFLLCSAFAVAPMVWNTRALGLLIGIVFVFAINQARILLLFYAYRSDHALFDLLHASITPIAIVLLVSAYFYTWLFLTTRRVQSA